MGDEIIASGEKFKGCFRNLKRGLGVEKLRVRERNIMKKKERKIDGWKNKVFWNGVTVDEENKKSLKEVLFIKISTPGGDEGYFVTYL